MERERAQHSRHGNLFAFYRMKFDYRSRASKRRRVKSFSRSHRLLLVFIKFPAIQESRWEDPTKHSAWIKSVRARESTARKGIRIFIPSGNNALRKCGKLLFSKLKPQRGDKNVTRWLKMIFSFNNEKLSFIALQRWQTPTTQYWRSN